LFPELSLLFTELVEGSSPVGTAPFDRLREQGQAAGSREAENSARPQVFPELSLLFAELSLLFPELVEGSSPVGTAPFDRLREQGQAAGSREAENSARPQVFPELFLLFPELVEGSSPVGTVPFDRLREQGTVTPSVP
jgi:hypothetical protein